MIAIEKGHEEIAKLLLADSKIIVGSYCTHHFTIIFKSKFIMQDYRPSQSPLYDNLVLLLATERGYKDIVEIILSKSDINNSNREIFI